MAGVTSKAVQSGTCTQFMIRFCSSPRLRPAAQHSARRVYVNSSSSFGASGYTPDDRQGPDLVNSMLNSCLNGAAHVTDATVSRLSDALQSVAPASAPRSKIEISVKGALVLLLLGLLKGVISLVLLVGCVGLAVYTATQVFGWNGVVLSQTGSNHGDSSYQRPQQYPHDQPPPGQSPQQRYPGQPAYGQPQQQQQYGYRQHGRQPQGGSRRRAPPEDQGDVVDVFHYPRPAPE